MDQSATFVGTSGPQVPTGTTGRDQAWQKESGDRWTLALYLFSKRDSAFHLTHTVAEDLPLLGWGRLGSVGVHVRDDGTLMPMGLCQLGEGEGRKANTIHSAPTMSRTTSYISCPF